MKINDVIHGFRVDRVRKSDELGGSLWEMTYEKTGTQLVWMDNGESNKVFSIAFKTLPCDDTGVFHILEHSVLCGSDKYPVKEPFVELLKSSMNTFLNAMTFPDKTVYPVSSRNEQDYLNLASVYLDAVFCPAIYKNPCIFWQEGWHYELAEADAAPSYKGVVFNEMKGAFSSSDTVMNTEMNRALFPDNCYRYVSGGDPKHIPELTYTQFLDAHREYYHPSNARIYLDGAVPLNRVLDMVEQYLCRYEKQESAHIIPMQKPTPSSRVVKYYEIGEGEDTAYKSHFAIGKIVCDWSDKKKILALTLLSDYLTGTNESPLKRAVLQSGLAQNVDFGVMDGVAQPYCSLEIRNTELAHIQQLKKIVADTIADIIDRGVDAAELNAVINQMEFRTLQVHEPKGLMRNFSALKSWLYDGDPMLHMEYKEEFRQLRQEIGSGYYEDLLREVFLEDSHGAEVLLLPSATKGKEDRQEEDAQLQRAQDSWSSAVRKKILEINRTLGQWQNTADTAEALSALPILPLDEITPEPEKTETEEHQIEDTTVLFHKVNEDGVVHLNLHFSLTDFAPAELSAVAFMKNLFGALPTKTYTVTQLQQLLRENIGVLNYNVMAYTHEKDSSLCKPVFTVSLSVLETQVEEAIKLVTEMLRETVFTGEESSALIESILLQREEGVRQALIMNGHQFANMRAASHFTAGAAALESAQGFTFYNWLHSFAQNVREEIKNYQVFAQKAAARIFCADRMIMSVTAKRRNAAAEKITTLLPSGGKENTQYMTIFTDQKPAKEFIQIPAGVSYAVASGSLRQYGRSYDGGLAVLGNLLSYDYLWNKVRVQGGAYGCGFRASETRNTLFYSYRDPSPHNSLKTFADTAEYIRAFCQDEPALDKYIISTVASTEPLRTSAQQGTAADSDYFCGITYEDRRCVRQQMCSLKWSDLLAYCNLFDEMAQKNAYCIVGGSDAAAQCDEGWSIYTL